MTERIPLHQQIAYLSIALSASPEGLRRSSRKSEADRILAGAQQALDTLREIEVDEQAHRAIIVARKRGAA
ncbi:hypothetical protein ACETRX_04010 [Labrys portucalensis]|uniref:DUF982 domain-containing protein n=1 Tax=Labrys neptuniae TaxID=376174 RepID=A0ABV6Z996_9HYPH